MPSAAHVWQRLGAALLLQLVAASGDDFVLFLPLRIQIRRELETDDRKTATAAR